MKRPTKKNRIFRRAFTMVELLVAMALTAMLTLMLTTIFGLAGDNWQRGQEKISQFREARSAFNKIKESLSQATLATYWDYEFFEAQKDIPKRFIPQSDLVFVTGLTSELLPSSSPAQATGHTVFFTAPLGRNQSQDLVAFSTLMNLCGYFVDFSERDLVPSGKKNKPGPSSRFQLMAFVEPTEKFDLFANAHTIAETATTDFPWQAEPVRSAARPVAENIIWLGIFPQFSSEDPGKPATQRRKNTTFDSRVNGHDLPPLLRIVMIAISEKSADWLQSQEKLESLLIDAKFRGESADDLEKELDQLKNYFNTELSPQLDYRVFDSTITLKASKWNP